MSRKLLARIGGTTAAVIALSATVLTTPASAGPPLGEEPIPSDSTPLGPFCDAGYHCVFFFNLGSARHSYFNTDDNFTNDVFDNHFNVNDNIASASNSSTGGYESHYYYDVGFQGGLVFCVNPGGAVDSHELTTDGIRNNHVAQQDEASSLRLRPTTTIPCFN
ncbi:hypothetical protein DMH04_30820 [Kibdelosporangium aridum]|uniref:Peptidase inhibitor family I36 n=1 Tax=Kibdelosporangium aridum TaxID=2030 RepID=A0A428Z2P1_KIBAR|nr:hypothetical protein [Kibdelosporangium aridum]RSM79995.1 hypothetical protein DMH04_30820 [Kibdelosporangium aridum]